MKVTWEDFMDRIMDEGYMTMVHFNEDEDDEDYDENCVYCPECGEPIYEADYPMIDSPDGKICECPICEARI